jgi:nucleotide-binding universal stress UspA family protein
MTGTWTQEHLQHVIHEEVAAVVYAETHERPAAPAVGPAQQEQAPQEHGRPVPALPDVPIVLVGVDRSPASDTALAWAAAEAVRRGARLVLVRAEAGGELPVPRAEWDAQERDLSALAASVRTAHPRITDVTGELVVGPAGPVLAARAADADLLVVGSYGRGPIARAVLGSAAAYCAVHAVVPTVVVPHDWSSRHRSGR